MLAGDGGEQVAQCHRLPQPRVLQIDAFWILIIFLWKDANCIIILVRVPALGAILAKQRHEASSSCRTSSLVLAVAAVLKHHFIGFSRH